MQRHLAPYTGHLGAACFWPLPFNFHFCYCVLSTDRAALVPSARPSGTILPGRRSKRQQPARGHANLGAELDTTCQGGVVPMPHPWPYLYGHVGVEVYPLHQVGGCEELRIED